MNATPETDAKPGEPCEHRGCLSHVTPMKEQVQKLIALGACKDGLSFAAKFETWQECWDAIPRADWSLWLIGKQAGAIDSPERKKLVGVLAEISEQVLPIYAKKHPGDKRVSDCIDTLKAYAVGKATIEQVRKARSATAYAADATATAYAVYAYAADATATAYAADATATAYAAADAAAYAAYAAYAVAYAAYAATYAAAAARDKMRKTCADIVRKHYPVAPTI